MTAPLNFQQVILKLHEFWSLQGCVIWEPYNVQVGAGTGNPATLMRVLGPEPWRVAYVEPSIRPDDGRYGENPNRMQKFYQYQVILKPDPGNPQEVYLKSLEALGINPREHDIRFVEDNWESPALGAWGLGWEVWLDGQEITQFTYFQQAGGIELDPVSIEITYGIERIVLALQERDSVWDIEWRTGISYGEIMLQDEIEHCRYYFELADVDGLKQVYDVYETESQRALAGDAVIPAYDYVLKMSHLFNVLDTRGAIGVTERAHFFRRMRDMTRDVARAYLEKREVLGFPLLSMRDRWPELAVQQAGELPSPPTEPADFLLEIGTEELAAGDVDAALEQLGALGTQLFDDLRLRHDGLGVYGTPRRLVLYVRNVAPRQPDTEDLAKGPPVNRAFDDDGKPTKAAVGFARGKGVTVEDLQRQEIDGGEYVVALVKEAGRPATEILAEALPGLIANIKFAKSMRWNSSAVAFSRPIRWLVCLLGDVVLPFAYANIASRNETRGLRPYGSPRITLDNIAAYFDTLAEQGIIFDQEKRRRHIEEQVAVLATEVGGRVLTDAGLLDEVTNLVEAPVALRGTFEEKYLQLPREVLVTVMRKHQRYFAIEDGDGNLLPYFIAVRNGDREHLDKVIAGNEHVLRARFSDADYFYNEDRKQPLESYLQRLSTLVFQEKLGSMRDKNERVAGLIEAMGNLLGMDATDVGIAQRAAHLAKADLGTQMVIEMTSLQGTMGREYALLEGYPQEVADAIFEHWLPRGADDALPKSDAGILIALTDRLDSLVGLFAVGITPRATADPYGLRRAAQGIVQILLHAEIDLNLADAVDVVAEVQPVEVSVEVKAQVLEFIAGRLRAWLEEQGWPHDVITAVLAEQSTNPYRALVGIRELSEWVKREDWEHILDNFARCVRITRTEAKQYSVNAGLFQEEAERMLFDAYHQVRAQLGDDGNVDAFLTAFAPIVPTVAEFFDKVLVNTDDKSLRENRLGLLQAIGSLQDGRADLSQMSGF
ncbi:MAG: glycine--tRNA ligase subunit beta [Chloroflexi bacterium]|nr:MAG: glycine--tRNA ligase subunit beta [Chloroflexota bacterium]